MLKATKEGDISDFWVYLPKSVLTILSLTLTFCSNWSLCLCSDWSIDRSQSFFVSKIYKAPCWVNWIWCPCNVDSTCRLTILSWCRKGASIIDVFFFVFTATTFTFDVSLLCSLLPYCPVRNSFLSLVLDECWSWIWWCAPSTGL